MRSSTKRASSPGASLIGSRNPLQPCAGSSRLPRRRFWPSAWGPAPFLVAAARPAISSPFMMATFTPAALSRDVLERELSGHEARIGGVRGEAVTMRASLTFKNKQHTYCREYEIATPSDGGFVGLGCRGHDGKWALELHVPSTNSAKSGMKIAEGGVNTALDAIVDRMIDGDAFDIEQEAQAVRNGWK